MQVLPFEAKNIIGAAAFILSTVTLVLGFPLLVKMDADRKAGNISLVLFFAVGLLSRLAWLKYLWALNDFFVRSICGLEAISFAVLFIHMALTIKNKRH